MPPLLGILTDEDWMVRQAAHISLTNLTGMEFAFNALDDATRRAAQVRQWSDWWASVPAADPPIEVLDLLQGAEHVGLGNRVTASSTYRGPPEILLDGRIGPARSGARARAPEPMRCAGHGPGRVFAKLGFRHLRRHRTVPTAIALNRDVNRDERTRRLCSPRTRPPVSGPYAVR